MKKIEQTIDSREAAEMIGKEHKNLIRDINRYVEQINQSNNGLVNELKIEPVEFFRESTYKDDKGEMRPCYLITKKGCEFIAHKLTGTKGTAFTARYINRFHEMEDIITGKQEANRQEQIEQALLEARSLLEEKDRKIQELEAQHENYNTAFFRNEIERYATRIQSMKRLRQIYTISKKLYECDNAERSGIKVV